MTAAGWRRAHAVLTVAWFVMAVPIVLLWSDSVLVVVLLWSDSVLVVGLMSAYANAVGHFSAWQATRAEESGDE